MASYHRSSSARVILWTHTGPDPHIYDKLHLCLLVSFGGFSNNARSEHAVRRQTRFKNEAGEVRLGTLLTRIEQYAGRKSVREGLSAGQVTNTQTTPSKRKAMLPQSVLTRLSRLRPVRRQAPQMRKHQSCHPFRQSTVLSKH